MKMMLVLIAIFMVLGVKTDEVNPWVLSAATLLVSLVVLLTFLNF
jgi:hypothetical protein